MKDVKDPGILLLRRDRVVAGVVGLAVFAVYALSLSPGLYVGESLSSSAQALGYASSTLPANVFQHWLAGVCMRFLHFTLGASVQWFPAIVGAVCAALFYRLSTFFVYQNIREEHCMRQVNSVSLVAGLGTALTFAFSLGGWYASTRFTIYLVDLLMLLSLAYLFVVYARKPKFAWMLALAALYGAGLAQSAYFISFLPLMALGCMFSLWRSNRLSLMNTLWLGSAFLLGMLASFVLTALLFSMAGGGDAEIWSVVRQMIRHDYVTVVGLLPQNSWIWLLLSTVVPWMIALFIAGQSLNNERYWSHYLVHVLMTVMTVFALLGMLISPWEIAQTNARQAIPLFSYVLVAMNAGYLLAYWFIMLKVRRVHRSVMDPDSPVFLIGRPLGQIFFFGFALFAVATFGMNYVRHINGKNEKYLVEAADETLAHMNGRVWLLLNTRPDPNYMEYYLKHQAYKHNQELNIINLNASDSQRASIVKNIKENLIPQLPEENRQYMLNVLDLGIMTFVWDLYAYHPDFTSQHLANWGFPDLIMNSNTMPISEFMCFGSGLSWQGKTAFEMVDAYNAFLDRMDVMLPETPDATSLIDILRNDLRRHVSFLANNYAVTLADSSSEDMPKEEQNAIEIAAFTMFKRIIALYPKNFSAIINAFQIAYKTKNPAIKEELDALTKDLQALVDEVKVPYSVQMVTLYFGYIRSPEIYKRLLEQVTGIGPSGSNIASQLIRILKEDGDTTLRFSPSASADERLKAYEDLIKEEPNNAGLYFQIVRLSIHLNRVDDAAKWIAEAEKRNMGIDFSFEHATLLLLQGKVDEARIHIDILTEKYSKNYEILAMLAFIMIDQQDVAGVQRRVLDKIERELGIQNYYYQVVSAKLNELKAQLASAKNNKNDALDFLRLARNNYLNASQGRPEIEELSNQVLNLDFALADRTNARNHAEMFLQRDRKHSLASWVLGSLLFSEGNYAAAEQYFRQSIDVRADPRALNDYAEVLRRLKKVNDSEKYAREAIQAAEKAKAPIFEHTAWDTLARALFTQGKFDEARLASNQALRIVQENKLQANNAQLKLTRLHIAVATNASSEARELIKEIQNEISIDSKLLDRDETDEFRVLSATVVK